MVCPLKIPQKSLKNGHLYRTGLSPKRSPTTNPQNEKTKNARRTLTWCVPGNPRERWCVPGNLGWCVPGNLPGNPRWCVPRKDRKPWMVCPQKGPERRKPERKPGKETAGNRKTGAGKRGKRRKPKNAQKTKTIVFPVKANHRPHEYFAETLRAVQVTETPSALNMMTAIHLAVITGGLEAGLFGL